MSHAVKIQQLEKRIKELEASKGSNDLQVIQSLVDWFEERGSAFEERHAAAFKPAYKTLKAAAKK